MTKITMISGIVASLLFVGCGGDSASTVETQSNLSNSDTSSSPVENKKVGTGYYVDSAIEGVNYVCGDEEGVTDASGTFTFSEDSNCTFKIGDLVLREVNSSILEDNLTVFEDNQTVAQLLQTLDSDNNATNGIQLLPEVHDVLREQEVREIPKNHTELVDIQEGLKDKKPNEYRGEIVSEEEVKAHLDETRSRLRDENRTTQYDVDNNETHVGRDENSDNREMSNEPEHSNQGENSRNNELPNVAEHQNRDENSTTSEMQNEAEHTNQGQNSTNNELPNVAEHQNRDENATSSEQPTEEERSQRREERESRR